MVPLCLSYIHSSIWCINLFQNYKNKTNLSRLWASPHHGHESSDNFVQTYLCHVEHELREWNVLSNYFRMFGGSGDQLTILVTIPEFNAYVNLLFFYPHIFNTKITKIMTIHLITRLNEMYGHSFCPRCTCKLMCMSKVEGNNKSITYRVSHYLCNYNRRLEYICI